MTETEYKNWLIDLDDEEILETSKAFIPHNLDPGVELLWEVEVKERKTIITVRGCGKKNGFIYTRVIKHEKQH